MNNLRELNIARNRELQDGNILPKNRGGGKKKGDGVGVGLKQHNLSREDFTDEVYPVDYSVEYNNSAVVIGMKTACNTMQFKCLTELFVPYSFSLRLRK